LFFLPREKAAKALFLFITQIRSCAQESEMKKHKALRDAENLLQKEEERQRALRGPLPRASDQQ
jgi:hypothetical protein